MNDLVKVEGNSETFVTLQIITAMKSSKNETIKKGFCLNNLQHLMYNSKSRLPDYILKQRSEISRWLVQQSYIKACWKEAVRHWGFTDGKFFVGLIEELKIRYGSRFFKQKIFKPKYIESINNFYFIITEINPSLFNYMKQLEETNNVIRFYSEEKLYVKRTDNYMAGLSKQFVINFFNDLIQKQDSSVSFEDYMNEWADRLIEEFYTKPSENVEAKRE